MTNTLFDEHNQPTPLARATDPTTSHLAATHITQREGTPGTPIKPGTHKARMLNAYAQGHPLADHEAAQHADLYRAHICYWHRATDLLTDGYITPTGETRTNPDTGKQRRVCIITPKGIDAHQQLTNP